LSSYPNGSPQEVTTSDLDEVDTVATNAEIIGSVGISLAALSFFGVAYLLFVICLKSHDGADYTLFSTADRN